MVGNSTTFHCGLPACIAARNFEVSLLKSDATRTPVSSVKFR
jgi:hypothetical protein